MVLIPTDQFAQGIKDFFVLRCEGSALYDADFHLASLILIVSLAQQWIKDKKATKIRPNLETDKWDRKKMEGLIIYLMNSKNRLPEGV